MRLTSPEFENNGQMPSEFASERGGGKNVSPPLEWGDVPEGTRSMVLVVIDRNPVANNWIHWAVKDLPATATGLSANASRRDMPKGALELKNTAGGVGWSGPAPPPGSGVHRYEFDLIALYIESPEIPEKPSIDDVTKAVDGHVLGVGELNGMFGHK